MNVRLSFNMCMIGLLDVCIWLLTLPNVTSNQPKSKPISSFFKIVLRVTKTCAIQSPLPLTIKNISIVNNFGCHTTIDNKIMVKYGTLWHGFNVFWVTFHILWQKSWENSTIFLVSSVNSTKFLIFWQNFNTKKN
jgi:hypothetical protein